MSQAMVVLCQAWLRLRCNAMTPTSSGSVGSGQASEAQMTLSEIKQRWGILYIYSDLGLTQSIFYMAWAVVGEDSAMI